MSQKSYDCLFLMHNCNIHMFRVKCREFHILSTVYKIKKRRMVEYGNDRVFLCMCSCRTSHDVSRNGVLQLHSHIVNKVHVLHAGTVTLQPALHISTWDAHFDSHSLETPLHAPAI